MTDIDALHQKAMDLAMEGFMLVKRHRQEEAIELFARGFEAERQAALMLLNVHDFEPTRSIMFRSAAALALDAGRNDEAEAMALLGITSTTPESLRAELWHIADQVAFLRHTDVSGIQMLPNEFQLSLWGGNSVAPGVAKTGVLSEKMKTIDVLANRTWARKNNIPFEERPGRRGELTTYISRPRAASFAATIRIGLPAPQASLFQDSSVDVVNDLLTNLELFAEGEVEKLRAAIGDTVYYRNFVEVARRLSADGREVENVGITSITEGRVRRVNLMGVRDAKRFLDPIMETAKDADQKEVEVTGELRGATELGRNTIKVAPAGDRRKATEIRVPAGMMTDIVKPLWGSLVKVRAIEKLGRSGKAHLELLTIDPE